MSKRETLYSIERLVESQGEQMLVLRNLLIEQRVSNYPIFVFQKQSVNILGKQFIDESTNPDKWNVFATHLEEMYSKKIILEEKLEDFKFQYKNNNDKFCILLIDEDDYSFLFTPIFH